MQLKNDSQQITLFNDRKKRTTVTPEIEQRVVQLRKQRFNFAEIAKRTGVSPATASRIASKHGLPNENRYAVTVFQQEPAPVVTGNQNNTPNIEVCKDLFTKAKTVLETSDTTTQLKDIGQALGLIEAGLALLEV